jgi:uncharacterized protein YneF (UPF0154 family)
MRNLPHTSANLPNSLRNLAAVVATAAVFGLALMFSVVVVAVFLAAGTIVWGYLWWKTRELRKQMRNYPPRNVSMEQEMAGDDVIRGEVIEGEVIHVVDTREDR